MNPEDRYEGLDYRKMISWSSRLQREWPLFAELFADAPVRSILDLGCGPGEHCARFALDGWQTVGVDASRSQIEAARQTHPDLDFVQADLGELQSQVQGQSQLQGPFGAAVCIGNVLPSLDDDTFDRFLAQLSGLLMPGALFLIQQLEFGPILSGQRRSIGPIFRPAEGDQPQSAFLRIFCPAGDKRRVDFIPVRLHLHPGQDPPAKLERAESIQWRARRRDDVEVALTGHGFTVEAVWGSPEKDDHDPVEGKDLWVLARR